MPRQWATAVHEAGHAVAHILEGRAFVAVDIRPTAEHLGFVTDPMRRDYGGPIDDHALRATMAGLIAERMHTGRWALAGASSDLSWVAAWLSAFPRDQQEAFLRLQISDVSDLLAENWSHVLAVAARLLDRTHLEYREVLDLINMTEPRSGAGLSPRVQRTLLLQLLLNLDAYAAAALSSNPGIGQEIAQAAQWYAATPPMEVS